jgi:hypothetical protein
MVIDVGGDKQEGGREGGREGGKKRGREEEKERGREGGREGTYLREGLVGINSKDPVNVDVGGDSRDAAVVEQAEGFGDFVPVEGGVVYWGREGGREGGRGNHHLFGL